MMVSELDATRTLLVLQIDHSRVAGALAAHWGNETFARAEPYNSMVIAAGQHDMGWWDWEIKPSLDPEGRPIDYAGTAGRSPDWYTWYRHGIQRVAEQDPYAGLIVLLHGMGLTNQGFGLLPRMAHRKGWEGNEEFIDEGERLRAQYLEQLRQSPEYAPYATDEQIWLNYKLMQVYDQMGQFICNRHPFNSTVRRNGPPSTIRNVPVAPGKEDVELTIDVIDETRAIVRPYPFDESPLVLKFPARAVSSQPYRSRDEFLEDYYKAEPVIIERTLLAE